jgi:hypothetical protein
MRAVKNWDTGGLIDVPVSISGQQVGFGRMIKWGQKNSWQPELLTDWVKVN